MKRGFTIILMVLGLLLSLGLLRLWLPASTTGGPPPALQGEAALNHLKEQGLYGSLHEAVTAARYGFYQEPKQSGAWLADNPAQRLSARLTPDGLQVVTGGDEVGSHRLGMKLRSAGYGERQMAAKAGRMTASGARAEIHHELTQSQSSNPQSTIIEWYHNAAAGLEQGFTIESAPGKRRDGERLRVALALEGELRAEAVEGGQALEFRDDAGRRALRYDHLVVRDRAGRELEARMAVSAEEGDVWLEVDDREAVWPVTIDPTFTQQQKLEVLDAAIFDSFGNSAAISGDTVVVGAHLDDGAGGIDQGSTYVFVRSSGGVWALQQKLLALDGAADDRFGHSVAISGDTVVVGAPGDAGAAGPQQGSAYVFVRSGGVWTQQQKLEFSDPAQFDAFGFSVAISGDTVVVGSFADDGPLGGDQGSAHVFVRNGGVWTLQQKLLASDTAPNDHFGKSVAINGDTIVVGAPGDSGAAGFAQGSAYVFVRSGGVWTQQQKLFASDAAVTDNFGDSMAISGDTVVVGAPSDDGAAGIQQGSAYVFVRNGGVWTQQQKLEASDPAAGDFFSSSVAISGGTVVVGSTGHDGAAGIAQGAAYVFVHSSGVWTQQQKLLASDAAAIDQFGSSVAISGETVVVGAPGDDGVRRINKGSAYVFIPAPPNTPPVITAASVSRTQGLPASIGAIAQVNDAEDALNTLTVTVNGAASATVNGATVSLISVDSSGQVTASVGAACSASFTLRVTDSGGLFAEATLNVTVTPEPTSPVGVCPQKLEASDAAASDRFGSSVAISGETVVVGAPLDDGAAGVNQGSAYVFVRNGVGWSPQQRLEASDPAANDGFGRSVAISGETIVVGAAGDDGNQGSAYVFVRSGGVWTLQQKLLNPEPAAGDLFGISVAISGETVVVGASLDDGAAGIDQGSAYVFVRSGGVWSQQQKLEASDAAASDQFSASVAISGETVVAGAPGDSGPAGSSQGSAYVFMRSGGAWTQQQKLLNPDPATAEFFGFSAAISGETVVAGAFDDDATQGAAYVFIRSDGVWNQQQKLVAQDAAADDQFGRSVAISGEMVVVGAPNDDGAAGVNQGSAYVFVRSGGVWSQQQKLLNPDPAAGALFGISVAISGETVVVGASLDDGAAGIDQGSAYMFDFAPPNTPPTITAASVSRTQGLPASISTIATVNDAEDALNTLTVTVNGAASATVNGVTVSSISVDASGQVAASVGAACSASDASFTLRVTDSGGLFAEDTLNVTVTRTQLTALGPANVWVGLKNSDDVGTKFDLLAEVFKNETLIGSGQLNGVNGGSSGFNNAVLNTINLGLSAPVDVCPGDILKIKLSVRIAANSGHRSGTARLWFNDDAANSSFGVTIGGLINDHFLLDGFTLGTVAGGGPKKTIDVLVDRAVNGNPFKPFGTWSKTF
jgi:hypothetical protein